MQNRNLPLDALRGGLALLVVVYHLVESLKLPMPAWLSATGLVAVDAFFVLSGYALATVYWNTDFRRATAWGPYAAKRVLRIAPLLFLATLAVAGTGAFLIASASLVGIGIALRRQPTWAAASQSVVLACGLGWYLWTDGSRVWPTLSLLWGFIDPTLSIAGGSWSIGVELVFYALCPLVLLSTMAHRKALWGWLACAVMVAVVYQTQRSTELLPAHVEFAKILERWRAYVSPLNHAYFFIAGMLVRLHQSSNLLRASRWYLMAGSVLVYVALAGSFAPDHGWGRVIYSALAVALTAAVAAAGTIQLTAPLLRAGFIWLGEVSYGVYLLHFPVHSVVRPWGDAFPSLWIELAFTTGLTIVVAQLVYRCFERPFNLVAPAMARPRLIDTHQAEPRQAA